MKYLSLLVFLFLAGCATGPSRKTTEDVSPEQFAALYEIPESYWHLDTRFRQSKNYFFIDLYGWRTKSWTEYIKTWRVRRDSMPHNFPHNKREKITSTHLLPEESDRLNKAIDRARMTGIDPRPPILLINPQHLENAEPPSKQ